MTPPGARRSSIRHSVLYSALDKYTQQILLVVTTAVMARLLTPAETGLFLVANSVLLLADNLRTFGVGIYIVQAAELKPTTLRSAFTVTLLLSLAIMALLLLGAEPIASFYGEPRLADLFRLGAVAFLAVPFATPIVALLQRELAFRDLALLGIAVALTNAVVTIAEEGGVQAPRLADASRLEWQTVSDDCTSAPTGQLLSPVTHREAPL